MFAMETRLSRVKAGLGPRVAEIDRPLAVGLVRPIVPVRPAARGVPRASPSPHEPAAARGRLAGLGVTWPGAGRARRAPAPAGCSTASRPAS